MISACLRLFAGRVLCCRAPRLHLSCVALSPNKGASASHALFFAHLSWRFCAVCVSVSSDGTFSTAPLARHTEGCHLTADTAPCLLSASCSLVATASHCLRATMDRWVGHADVPGTTVVHLFVLFIFCTSFVLFCHLHPPPLFPRCCSVILSPGASQRCCVVAVLLWAANCVLGRATATVRSLPFEWRWCPSPLEERA